jgi:hypothetical protein
MTGSQRTLLLGSDTADVRRLAEALDADLELLPTQWDSGDWAYDIADPTRAGRLAGR